MDLSNVVVDSVSQRARDLDDTWGKSIELYDDTYVPEYDHRVKEKAIYEFHAALMDYCGLPGDTCTIIINYLPFQRKWVRFNPITCDGIASIFYFVVICIHNFLHYLIGFILISSDSLLISIALILLSVIESVVIFYFYRFKYNCFVNDNILDMADSFNNWLNFTIQIFVYVPMTILLFIFAENTLMQLLFLIFYTSFIIAQSFSQYRQFEDAIDARKNVHPSIYLLVSLAIILLHDIYTHLLVIDANDSVDAIYTLHIFTFYAIITGNIFSTFKAYENPSNIISWVFLCGENLCYFILGIDLLNNTNDSIAFYCGHLIIPINVLGIFIILFVHLRIDYCEDFVLHAMDRRWHLKYFITLLMEFFVWTPMQMIVIIYILWGDIDEIPQSLLIAMMAYFIQGFFQCIWLHCSCNDDDDGYYHRPKITTIWRISAILRTTFIYLPFGITYLAIYGWDFVDDSFKSTISVLLVCVGSFPVFILVLCCCVVLIVESVQCARRKKSIFRCRAGFCRRCPFHDECGCRHCPCACCW